MESYADMDLVLEVKKGNRRAFACLVKRYERPLLRLLLKFVKDEELARDILQEALFKTYMSLAQFENRCSFKNWLYKIALNTARNKLRAMRESENIDDVVIFDVCMIEHNMEREETMELVRRFVDRLPEKQKKTLELRVFQDLSFKEVSEIMDCPYDTAKANYRHALMKIKGYFAAS